MVKLSIIYRMDPTSTPTSTNELGIVDKSIRSIFDKIHCELLYFFFKAYRSNFQIWGNWDNLKFLICRGILNNLVDSSHETACYWPETRTPVFLSWKLFGTRWHLDVIGEGVKKGREGVENFVFFLQVVVGEPD